MASRSAKEQRATARAASGSVDLELHFAHVDGGARARRVGRVHRVERLSAGVHVLRGGEVLKHYRRSVFAVVEHLEGRAGYPGRRSAGLLDTGQQALDPLGAHIGEPDDTYVHGSDLHEWLTRPYRSIAHKTRISRGPTPASLRATPAP